MIRFFRFTNTIPTVNPETQNIRNVLIRSGSLLLLGTAGGSKMLTAGVTS